MRPDLPPLLDAAFAAHQAGNLAEASRLYHEILQHHPLQPDALHMLGIIAKQQGNNDLALKLIEVALGQKPDMPLAWHNRSLLLRILGRKDEALQSAEQALAADPNFADSWDMAGFLLRDKGEFERSLACHTRAVELQPDNIKFRANYAMLQLATGDLANAYRMMLDIEKRDADFLPHTMGNILKRAGYTDLALPYFRKSSALLPQHDEIRVTEAMALLQAAQFEEGWKIWETRPSLDARFKDVPFWDGKPVEHLLVHEDQGLGDAFQFARYIGQLRPYAKRITIQVTRVLRDVFATSFPQDQILTLDDPVPTVDGRIRMLSLPAFFTATESNIPSAAPYLTTREEWREPWQTRLAHIPHPRIGLVWGGNPDHLNDRMRSLATHDLQPLLQTGNHHLVSLQKGKQKSGVDLAAHGIFDADPFLHDFSDTAGLMQELDLLISVDTSVVHLAGALGLPVWLMLPFDPDWRWLIGREDSPWYPHLRIFRQTQPRRWDDVITRITTDMQRLIAGDRNTLQPARWNDPCLQRNPLAVSLPFPHSFTDGTVT